MQQQNGLHCGCDGISVGSTKWYFAIIYTAEHYTALKSGCDGISVGWEQEKHTWSNQPLSDAPTPPNDSHHCRSHHHHRHPHYCHYDCCQHFLG